MVFRGDGSELKMEEKLSKHPHKRHTNGHIYIFYSDLMTL